MTRPDPHDATLDRASAPSASFAGGRYTVERVLGSGGQKFVYLVVDTALGRRCALSLVSREGLTQEDAARLRREAQAMASLGAHPNVVTVFDIGTDEGRPYIVCEYVAGGDLRAEIERAGGALPNERALQVIRGILSALDFVHAHALVHRDVKPANVWLTETGAIKLGDFGLALSSDRSRLTVAGTMLGTPAYMAPEQIRGDPTDGRADLYAAGCVLYEMLTGRLPFSGEPMAILYQHMHAEPMPPSRVNGRGGAALDRFVLSLLAKEAERRPPSAALALAELEEAFRAPAEERPVPGASRVGHLPFVGRSTELDLLRAALESALAGVGGVRAIAGEPGVGKTRLVQELGLHARLRGARVLVGRCADTEGSPPYLPFVEALDAELSRREVEDVRALVSGEAAAVVEILPGTRARIPDHVPARRGAPEGDRYVLFQGVVALLRGLASPSGLLLVLEDIHWSDEPSLLLLHHLARKLEGTRILVVATYRDIEVSRGHRLAQLLADMRRERLFERVSLRGLGLEEVRALAESASESVARLAQSLHDRTNGNPFFVAEVLKHLAESDESAARTIPEGVREVVGRRLSRLSEACNRMLTIASAMPQGAPWEVLRAVVEEPEDRILDLLDEALAAQVLRERAGAAATYEFTHALIRETLYEEVSTPRRARLHRRIGEAIERAAGTQIDARLADLAFHFHEAAGVGDATKAVEYSTRAGDAAMGVLAFEDAERHYSRALDLSPASQDDEPRAALDERRGRALHAAGSWRAAREAFDSAVARTAPADTDKRVERILLACEAMFWAIDVPALTRYVDLAFAVLGEVSRSDLLSGAYAWRALVKSCAGDIEDARADLEAAAEQAGGRYLTGLQATPSVFYWLGRIEESAAWALRIYESARAANDPSGQLLMLQNRGCALSACGRYAESRAAFHQARTLGARYGNKALLSRAISMSTCESLDLGDHRGAMAIAYEARDLAASMSFWPPHVSSGLDLLFCNARLGEPGEAERLLPDVEVAIGNAGGWHGWHWRLRLAAARAEIALARGDRDRSIRHATEAVELSRRYKRAKYEAIALVTRATARGPHAESEADLRAAVEIARRMGDVALLVRTAGPLATRFSDAQAGEAASDAARRILKALPDETSRTKFAESDLVRTLGVR